MAERASLRRAAGRLALLLSGPLAAALCVAPARAADGATLFAETCSGCHGAAGAGIEGIAPPLVDAELWDRLGDKGSAYVAGVMAGGLSGKITVGGIDYIGLVMPPQDGLPDEDLAAIAAYVLGDLNGRPASPSAAEIAAARAAPPSHKALRTLRGGG